MKRSSAILLSIHCCIACFNLSPSKKAVTARYTVTGHFNIVISYHILDGNKMHQRVIDSEYIVGKTGL